MQFLQAVRFEMARGCGVIDIVSSQEQLEVFDVAPAVRIVFERLRLHRDQMVWARDSDFEIGSQLRRSPGRENLPGRLVIDIEDVEPSQVEIAMEMAREGGGLRLRRISGGLQEAQQLRPDRAPDQQVAVVGVPCRAIGQHRQTADDDVGFSLLIEEISQQAEDLLHVHARPSLLAGDFSA